MLTGSERENRLMQKLAGHPNIIQLIDYECVSELSPHYIKGRYEVVQIHKKT